MLYSVLTAVLIAALARGTHSATQDKEVVGFAGQQWRNYDLDLLTSVCWNTDPEFVELAHSKGIRVNLAATTNETELLTSDETVRTASIARLLDLVNKTNADGVNFDYESVIMPDEKEKRDNYVAYVNQTTRSLRALLGEDRAQVSVDVAWSPVGVDYRFYDYKGLADASDFLFVMAYDMQSQVLSGRCVAAATSPLEAVERGLLQFIGSTQISPDKLVLGIPWYGYRYPCSNITDSASDICYLASHPWRNASCSDAVGREYPYSTIQDILAGDTLDYGNITYGPTWDPFLRAPYFNTYVESSEPDRANPRETQGTIYQWWFDDVESLSLKYDLAKRYNLKGVGMYALDDLDYSNSTRAVAQRQEMWQAIKDHFLD